MKMTPEQEKETLMYTRLPELARIVRTTFINEQKGVLLMEILLEKVQFSYNRSLGLSEYIYKIYKKIRKPIFFNCP